MSQCDCGEHRRDLIEAIEAHPLHRRSLLRGAVGVGTVAALAGAVPSWASSTPEKSSTKLQWLAGDLHVHTTLSHDVWSGFNDDNTSATDFYTLGWTPGQQIAIAESRGLNFVALTDHDRTTALFESDYKSSKLTLVPAYEHSLAGGHAGVFVTDKKLLHDIIKDAKGSSDFSGAAGIKEFLARTRELDALVVLNHPFYKRSGPGAPPTWKYTPSDSFGVGAVEVWNSLWLTRAGVTPLISYDDPYSLPWWEKEFLPKLRMPAVGGSDNHWQTLTAVAGVGQPTTWVQAAGTKPSDILAGIRAGRTTISFAPPALGGPRLEPSATESWKGGSTVGLGGTIAAHGAVLTHVTVRDGVGATLRLISNGEVVGAKTVTALDEVIELPVVLQTGGWIRFELAALNDSGITMLALTSPIYAEHLAPTNARKTPSTGPAATYPFPRI